MGKRALMFKPLVRERVRRTDHPEYGFGIVQEVMYEPLKPEHWQVTIKWNMGGAMNGVTHHTLAKSKYLVAAPPKHREPQPKRR